MSDRKDIIQLSESPRATRTHAAYAWRLDGRFVVRHFDPRSNSYESLTALLHRAYAHLGAALCPWGAQPASATRKCGFASECFVSLGNAHLIATITMRAHDPDSRGVPERRHETTHMACPAACMHAGGTAHARLNGER